MKTVFVGIPIHRHWAHESEDFFFKNVEAARYWKIHSISKLYEESLIVKAREKLLKEFLTTNADYLFFLDDDVCMTDDNTIDNLVTANKDIVGGVYICKKPPHNPTFCPLDRSHYPDIRDMKAPFEVEMIATGCMMISREVAKAMTKEYRYPFNLIETDDCLISEDFSFCMRARKLGYTVWADPRPFLVHLGTYGYSVNDFYGLLAQQEEREKSCQTIIKN